MTDNSLTIGDLKAQTKKWNEDNGSGSSETIEVTDREKDAIFTLHYKHGDEYKTRENCSRNTKIAEFKKELGETDEGDKYKLTFLDGTDA